MNKFIHILNTLVISCVCHQGYAQKIPTEIPLRKPIQFSGVVVNDSLQPVPYVNIIVKHTFHGTTTDFYGYFSIVAEELDTIEFSAIGYKKGTFVIPDTLTTNRYSLIHMLSVDTVVLDEVDIYPWPTREQFKEAFLHLRIPDDNYERAMNNLAMAELRERMGFPHTMDGHMNYTHRMREQQSRLYWAGQYPMNSLLNPLAWAQFIEAWQRGDFKKQR